MLEAIPYEWHIDGLKNYSSVYNPVIVQKHVRVKGDSETISFSINISGLCVLNKKGVWVADKPSCDKDNEYYQNYRFNSLQECLDILEKLDGKYQL